MATSVRFNGEMYDQSQRRWSRCTIQDLIPISQLPLERPKTAEGTQSAPALWTVNCSDLLGGYELLGAANGIQGKVGKKTAASHKH
ncbi:MAG: hypothetical protein CMN26_01805 [Salinisphaera sp.]|nr:hypothetical protein [Salinisphaera sp.]MAS08798.1 hypothetical protein [Salinisphaera sp.]|tara:strand:- start:1181 stop:1438 length:258 start_codon:yes stop_codon:yes gene_type:complete